MVSSKDLDNVTHSELVQKFCKSCCTLVLSRYETQRRRCLKQLPLKFSYNWVKVQLNEKQLTPK